MSKQLVGGWRRCGRLLAALGATAGIWLVAGVAGRAAERTVSPVLDEQHADEWLFERGRWEIGNGELRQLRASRASAAFLKGPAFSDFTLSVEFYVEAKGRGVRAAAVIFRATGTRTYYWLHLDTRNDGIILVRSTPMNSWIEIRRVRHRLDDGRWHAVVVRCAGATIRVYVDGERVLEAQDSVIAAGRIGLGTSQGAVRFRSLRIQGEMVAMSQPLRNEEPPYKVISRGEAAGPYQAFPDACRLANGDIMCVFYAGYGHVSLPNEQWPKGGRICYVRSSDEGRTWTEPGILYDDADDNRDPHIAQLADGTLVCSFFSLRPREGGGYSLVGVQLVRSRDGGQTWDEQAELVVPGWACSAPVRQMPDGTCILGVYRQEGDKAWGGVIRSTDGGKTWSQPIPIGREAGLPLDAETDVILLKDGTLFAALRSSRINMHCATSPDLGLTWSPVRDIGFKGHCPHLTRLTSGRILLCHRVPNTSMHISDDEAKSWRGPYSIDNVPGAYPATVELRDGTVLVVYYEEGEGSAIRAMRLRILDDGIEPVPW